MGSLNPPRNGGIPGYASTMTQRERSQWLFTEGELRRTPSILAGLPPEQELINRAKGVNFITQVGIALKLPQLTLATACVYLHRFFMRHSMATPTTPGIHHYAIAATSLFLATKVEENCRKMKELVVACCRVAQKQPDLVVDEQDKEFWKWRDTILSEEDRLLESLCFDLQLDQPYKILFDFMCYYNLQDNKRLRNAAWAFVTDSYNTTLCLRYTSRLLAGVAFFGGVSQAEVQLPDDEHGRAWWDHLELNILDVNDAWNVMAECYGNASQPPQQDDKITYTRHDDFLAFDKTRSAASPGYEQSPFPSVAGSQAGQKHDRDDGDQNSAWGASPKRPRRDSASSKEAPTSASRIPLSNGAPPPPQSGAVSGLRVPPPTSFPAASVNGDTHDPAEVQRRIDNIVNESSASIPLPPPPILSRVPSNETQYSGSTRVPPYQEIGPPPLPQSSSRVPSGQERHNGAMPRHPMYPDTGPPAQQWQPPLPSGPGDYSGVHDHERPPLRYGNDNGRERESPSIRRVPSREYPSQQSYDHHPHLPRRPSFENSRPGYDQEKRRSYEYRTDERLPQQHQYHRRDGNAPLTNGSGRPPDEGRNADDGSEEGEL